MKNKIIDIVYEDNDLWVLNKPANLLSIPDRFLKDRPCLLYEMNMRFGKENVFVVHRLDYQTSGLILFAKNSDAHRLLQSQFDKNEVIKKYLAICNGFFPEDSQQVICEAHIAESLRKKGTYEVHKSGKWAKTTFKVLEKIANYYLIEAQIFTGRTHQIRVHLSHISCPLLVDEHYSDSKAWFLSSIKRRFNVAKYENELPMLDRTPLHSAYLSFLQPTTQQRISLSCEMHKDMRATWTQLNKHIKI